MKKRKKPKSWLAWGVFINGRLMRGGMFERRGVFHHRWRAQDVADGLWGDVSVRRVRITEEPKA